MIFLDRNCDFDSNYGGKYKEEVKYVCGIQEILIVNIYNIDFDFIFLIYVQIIYVYVCCIMSFKVFDIFYIVMFIV